MKKSLLMLTCTVLLLTSGCGKKEEVIIESPNVNVDKVEKGEDIDTTEVEINNGDGTVSKDDVENYIESTKENDTDIGLRNVKIDTAIGKLTEDQLKVLEYFGSDYLEVISVETLLRYPDIFEKAQVSLWCSVGKVLKSDSDEFEILVYLLENSDEIGMDYKGDSNRYIIIRGKQSSKRYIVGDVLNLYGRYNGTETFDIDGVSEVIPVITVHSAYLQEGDGYFYPSRMSMKETKQVAKSIFGDNITIRLGTEELDEGIYWTDPPVYTCILDDQSNAKLNKFYFEERFGRVSMPYMPDSINQIEFSADFKHFFYFSIDTQLDTLTLEYYDQNLKKLWKKEMEETVNAVYDLTKHNIYLIANNELRIIDIETGEDTFPARYVGEKLDVRKLNDGLLLVSKNKSDGIMKTSLDGTIQWKVNLPSDIEYVNSVQIIEDKIVVVVSAFGDYTERENYYIVLDNETGEIISSEEITTESFYRFG